MNATQKHVLRRQLLEYRSRMPAVTRDAFSRVIVGRIIQTIDWRVVRRVHCYIPIVKKHEVDTWVLFQYVWRMWPNIKTTVPGPLRSTGPTAYIVDRATKWSQTSAIPYPSEPIIAGTERFDLIIVPCLGFDKDCYRLGYGAGYYDRFLASQGDAVTIGVAFQAGFVAEGLPHEKHDVALRRIITEEGTLERVA